MMRTLIATLVIAAVIVSMQPLGAALQVPAMAYTVPAGGELPFAVAGVNPFLEELVGLGRAEIKSPVTVGGVATQGVIACAPHPLHEPCSGLIWSNV